MIVIYGFVLCLLLPSLTSCEDTVPFTRSVLLADGRYLLRWGFSGQDRHEVITFEVTAQTLGWVGLGLSPNGAMKDADIVVSGVDDAGKPYLYDLHADCNCRPTPDQVNNYEIVGGSQNDTHTVITFSRMILSCDKEDYKLEDGTIRLLWAMHAEDAASANSFSKHEVLDRGVRSTFLLQRTETAAIDLPDDVVTFDLVVNDVKIPDDWHTLYWCKILELPKWGKHHLIKYTPIFTKGNEAFLHHIVIYLCDKDMTGLAGRQEACFNRNVTQFSPIHTCQSSTFAAWAVGSEGVALPEGFGYPLMEEGTSPFLMMEVHYDNSNHLPTPIPDNSGMRLYMTPTLRDVEFGIINIGMGVSPDTLLVPPNQSSIKLYGICDGQCTSRWPPEGIHVVSGFLHEHVIGSAVSVRHFRNGKELPPIITDKHYDFKYQDQKYLKEPVHVLPNDSLVIECEYDSTGRTEPTYGGYGTPQEMCFAFINYYPGGSGMDNCVSSPHIGTYAAGLGTTLAYGVWEPIFIHPETGANITISEYSKLVNWGKAKPGEKRSAMAESFQNEIIKGLYWETCGGKPRTQDTSGASKNVDQTQPQLEVLSQPDSNAPGQVLKENNDLDSIATRPSFFNIQYDFHVGISLNLPESEYSTPDPCAAPNNLPPGAPQPRPTSDQGDQTKTLPEPDIKKANDIVQKALLGGAGYNGVNGGALLLLLTAAMLARAL